MADNILESYFIRVGAIPDTASFTRLGYVLKDATNMVEGFSLKSVKSIMGVQVAAIGAFAAVGTGLITLADRAAMTDQSYRLFGLRMLMTKDSARAMQVALDELGATIDEVAYDPELNKRFQALYEHNMKLGKSMGANFDKNMKGIRDIRQEYKMFAADFDTFLIGGVISKLFDKLGYGDGGVLGELQNFNDWFDKNLPQISDEISTDLVSVWNDVVIVLKDVTSMLGMTDLSIKGIGKNIVDITDDITKFILTMDLMEKIGVHAAKALAISFGALGKNFTMAGGIIPTIDYKGFKRDAEPGADEAVKMAADIRDVFKPENWANNPDFSGMVDYNLKHTKPKDYIGGFVDKMRGPKAGSMQDLAFQVSRQTGIPANLILDQWAHETGGFTSSVFKNNNNAAGIENSDKTYKDYGSMEEFAKDYVKIITSKRYTSKGISGAKTIEDFASALKAGGYYEDSEKNYAAGMSRYDSAYSHGGGDVIIQNQTIVVPPGTSHQEGAAMIVEGMRKILSVRDQIVMAQTAGGAYS